MPTYRTVLNVEPWEEGVYDWAIDNGLVNVSDSFTDDARRVLDDGRFFALLKRYHDRFVKPVHEDLWAGQADLGLAVDSTLVATASNTNAIESNTSSVAALLARIEALEGHGHKIEGTTI